MRLLVAAPGRARNSLGRAYCLWLLGRELGWQVTPVTPPGGDLWPPLAGSEFARACRTWDDPIGDHDLVVAVKMVHGSLGEAGHHADRTGSPLLLDIDEPDWEARYGYTGAQRLRVASAMLRRGRSPLPSRRLRARARRAVRTVSNPSLLDLWPGVVVPHVREPRAVAPLTWEPGRLRVAFVGTPRSHKGLEQLRTAVSRVPGAMLSVTAPPPADARPHEVWLGAGTMEEGAALLDRSDVSVVPSTETPFARAQLPVKIIDAMMAGRAVVASDLPPIRWALGDAGVLVRPGSVAELTRALERLTHDDSTGVAHLGARARERAIDRFTPEAVAPAFASAAYAAMGVHEPEAGPTRRRRAPIG
jgi:glycosyltransferase involved in cell wall biosynthesis